MLDDPANPSDYTKSLEEINKRHFNKDGSFKHPITTSPGEQKPPFRLHLGEDVNNPGLEQELRNIIWNAFSPFVDYEGFVVDISLAEEPVKTILALITQREAQAYQRGRRDEREDCLTVAKWWVENDGRPKHLLQDLDEPNKTTLDHIPELEKGKPE